MIPAEAGSARVAKARLYTVSEKPGRPVEPQDRGPAITSPALPENSGASKPQIEGADAHPAY